MLEEVQEEIPMIDVVRVGMAVLGVITVWVLVGEVHTVEFIVLEVREEEVLKDTREVQVWKDEVDLTTIVGVVNPQEEEVRTDLVQ